MYGHKGFLRKWAKASMKFVALALAAQTQTLDQVLIAGGIFSVEIIQQFPTLIYHSQQTTTRVVIMLVCFEMFSQM